MNKPPYDFENRDMTGFWKFCMIVWLTCHWLAFLGYLELYRMDINGELSGNSYAVAAVFGGLIYSMIPGVLVSLLFPGKRLKYSVLFILPVVLSMVVAFVLHQLGYDE